MMANPRDAFRRFASSVAFITTKGGKGPNVMTAEWIFNVSYNPFLVSVHLKPSDATFDAISETGEFGVGLISEDQITAMSFAGHFTRHETDKFSSELFDTYPAKKIDVPMIKGCTMNMECKLTQRIPMGDHTAFVGEVVDFTIDPSKKPIAYQAGAYRLNSRIERATSIALAVTPRKSRPGERVVVEGELTCAERGGREVNVSLETIAGASVLTASARTDEYGFFLVELMIPSGIHAGAHRVVARLEETEGGARITVG